MIDITSVSFSANPCTTGQSIQISVGILYEEDKYIVPSHHGIIVNESEIFNVSVYQQIQDVVRVADENEHIMLDENGTVLIDTMSIMTDENENIMLDENDSVMIY